MITRGSKVWALRLWLAAWCEQRATILEYTSESIFRSAARTTESRYTDGLRSPKAVELESHPSHCAIVQKNCTGRPLQKVERSHSFSSISKPCFAVTSLYRKRT